MNNFNGSENVLFTIKELDIIKNRDGKLSLIIKNTDELLNYITDKFFEDNMLLKGNDFNLTDREKEVLKYLAKGKNNKQIAQILLVSVHTVKAHVANILQKMAVNDRVQAAVKAVSEKILDK